MESHTRGLLSRDLNIDIHIDEEASFRGQKTTGKAAVRKPIVSGSSAKDIDPRIVQQVNMASHTGCLSQDQNLGVCIDGKARFRGQKKTGGASVRKPTGEASFGGQNKTGKAVVRKPTGVASFRGQKKTGGADLRKLFGDSPNSGEPIIINQPGGKKALDGPLISGKRLESEKLASEKEEAVSSKDKNLDSKRIDSNFLVEFKQFYHNDSDSSSDGALKSEKLASVKEEAVPSKDKNLDFERLIAEFPNEFYWGHDHSKCIEYCRYSSDDSDSSYVGVLEKIAVPSNSKCIESWRDSSEELWMILIVHRMILIVHPTAHFRLCGTWAFTWTAR